MATESVVPIIDIGALHGDDARAKFEVAQQIGKACEDIGFLVLVNHGIPDEVINTAWVKTGEFFDLPQEEKDKCKTQDEAKYPYGYSALGGEILSAGKNQDDAGSPTTGTDKHVACGDLKEMMQIGPDNPDSGMGVRILPDNPQGFAEAWVTYYNHVNELAKKLLKAFAMVLNVEEDFFESKLDRHISALRANNYPCQEGMQVPAGSIRCSAHTDYGTVTILRSGGPGLQVSKDKDEPVWHDVPYIQDAYIVNLGDLMRRWTNDRWVSTLHRVINPPEDQASVWGRRLAMAFFHNVNKDSIIEAIPSCVEEGAQPLYDPIVAGEFLMMKHLASQGKADADAHLKKKVQTE